MMIPKTGDVCSPCNSKIGSITFIECNSCGSSCEFNKSALYHIKEVWKCWDCRRRRITIYDDVKRCSNCKNRIIHPSNERHRLYTEDSCFKCILFSVVNNEFDFSNLSTSVEEIIDHMVNSRNLNDDIAKLDNIFEDLNNLFLNSDLDSCNYLFLNKPINSYCNFLEFLSNIIYCGEGKDSYRYFETIYEAYLGENPSLRDKIFKAFNERSGFYVLNYNSKFSKVLVTWIERSEIFILKKLNRSLANINHGKGKINESEDLVLLFLGILSLYKQFTNLDQNLNASNLYTNDTTLEFIRRQKNNAYKTVKNYL